MCQGVYCGLVSVILSSWGSDVAVYLAVARNMHHGSQTPAAAYACQNKVVVVCAWCSGSMAEEAKSDGL